MKSENYSKLLKNMPKELAKKVKSYMRFAMSVEQKCENGSCLCRYIGECRKLEFRKLSEAGDK